MRFKFFSLVLSIFPLLSFNLLLASPAEAKVLLADSAIAQAPATTTKQALIEELVELTGGEKIFEQMIDQIFAQLKELAVEDFMGLDPNATALSPEEKEGLIAAQSRLTEVLARIEIKMRASLSFDDLLEQIIYPLYDKYFTEEQLRDLLAFYKTPSGSHLIQVMPQLMQESGELSMQIMMPRMMEIMQEVFQEEFQTPDR